MAAELRTGRIDAAVGNLPAARVRTRSALLFAKHYVCIMSARHALADKKLTLSRFVTARHVAMSSPFSAHRLLDEALAERC